MRLESIPVGAHFSDYESYVVITHFTGDAKAGYAGAIENTAFGLASAMGKVRIQSGGLSNIRLLDGAMMNFRKPWLKPGWQFPMPAPAISFIST